MTWDAYRKLALDALDARLEGWAGVQGATHSDALVGLAVALAALWLGTVLATRLLAQTGAGAAFGLALTWLVLAFAAHAAIHLYAPPPAGQGAIGFAALALMVFAASRGAETSMSRGFGVLALSAGFGGLAGVVLALFWRLVSSI